MCFRQLLVEIILQKVQNFFVNQHWKIFENKLDSENHVQNFDRQVIHIQQNIP